MQLTPNRFDYWANPTMQRVWALMRFELLYLLWATMEMALITPLALAIFSWTEIFSTGQWAAGVLICIMIPFYLARALTWVNVPRGRQQQILVATAVFLVILSVRNIGYETSSIFDTSWIGQFFRNLAIANDNSWQRDLSLFLLISICWWRGIMLVSYHIDTSRFGLRFSRSSLFLLPSIIVLATFRQEWSIITFIALYFVASLMAMTLTRVEQAERAHGAILSSMSPRWLSTIVGSSFLLTLLATGTAVFLSSAGQMAMNTLGPIWAGLQLSLTTTALTMAYLASPFLKYFEAFFVWLVHLFQRGFDILFDAAPPAEESDFQGPPNEWLIELLTQPPSEGFFASGNWRIALLVALIIFVIAVTWLVGSYYQSDKTVQNQGRFGKLINDMSSRIIPPRLRRQNKEKETDWRNWQTAVSIIKIYQDMLRAADQLGYPRDETETPYEFLSTLKIVWPENQKDTQIITQAYINIKYGQFPESKKELLAIQNAWKQLKNSRSIESSQTTHVAPI